MQIAMSLTSFAPRNDIGTNVIASPEGTRQSPQEVL